MLPTRLLRAREAYQPMIKFLGQRSRIEHGAHAPAPHPAAPREIADDFQSFLAKLQSSSGGPGNPSSQPKGQSTAEGTRGETGGREAENGRSISQQGGGSSSSSGKGAAGVGGSAGGLAKGSAGGGKPVDFENFWEAPAFMWKHPEVTEREIEAVMSGGATDIRSGP